jgi:hypothetical protein
VAEQAIQAAAWPIQPKRSADVAIDLCDPYGDVSLPSERLLLRPLEQVIGVEERSKNKGSNGDRDQRTRLGPPVRGFRPLGRRGGRRGEDGHVRTGSR